MGIHKRGKYWYSQFQVNGRTYIRSTKTANKTQAKEFDRKYRNEVYNQIHLGEREAITLHEAMDQYLSTKRDMKNHRGMTSNISTLKKYFDDQFKLHDLNTAAVERFTQKRRSEGFQSATIHHTLVMLRGSHRHGDKMGYKTVPIEWPTLKKAPARLRYLTVAEEHKLLKELDPYRIFGPTHQHDPKNLTKDKMQARVDNYDLVIALLDTGARYSEIAEMHWTQIDLSAGTLDLIRSKTENRSVLYLTDRLWKTLKSRFENRRNENFVFTDKTGMKPRNHSTNAIRKAMKRAGLSDVRVHDLRHTAASRLVQNGLSLLEVSKILGHSTITMTMRYAHLEPQDTAIKARDALNKVNQQSRPKLTVVK